MFNRLLLFTLLIPVLLFAQHEIVIDGQFDDWDAVTVSVTDPANDEHDTHYVVFAVNIVLETADSYDLTQVPDDQHSTLKWWDVEDILAHHEVHNYTKNYFHPAPYNKAFM